MSLSKIQQDRKERRKVTAEDFTPSSLVNEILDRLTIDSKKEVWQDNKTFLDPACGNGNFLIQVLQRKLSNKQNPIQALSSIFGCDIMKDNIDECRLRLLKVLTTNNITITKEHVKIVVRNIVCTPLDKYPNGSLDYLDLDESQTFNKTISDEQAIKALKTIITKNKLDEVSIADDVPSTEKPITKIAKEIPKKQGKSKEKEDPLKSINADDMLKDFF
jgi:SAM-dependent methyltransferase